jgi:type II secretory pathway component PulK
MAFFRGLTAVSRLRSRVAQEASTLGGVRWLQMQSASDLDLKSQLQELIPEQQVCYSIENVCKSCKVEKFLGYLMPYLLFF